MISSTVLRSLADRLSAMSGDTAEPQQPAADVNALDRGRRGSVALVAVACVCVTAGVLLSRQTLQTVPMLPFVFLQAVGGVLFTWTLCLLLGVLPRFRELPRLGLPGVFQPGMTYALFFSALLFIPLALAGSLTAFETIFVLLLSYPLLRERPTRAQISLAILGFGGLLLLSWTGGAARGHLLLGIFLVLASVFCAALDTVTSRALAQHSHPATLAAACATSGMLVLALALCLFPKVSWHVFASPRTLGITLLSGILIHGLGASLFNLGVRRITASDAALLFPSISVMTAVGGVVLFGERLSVPQVAGALVVFAAATIAGLVGGHH